MADRVQTPIPRELVNLIYMQNKISRLLDASIARNTQMSYITGLNAFQKFRSDMGYPLLIGHLKGILIQQLGHTSQL